MCCSWISRLRALSLRVINCKIFSHDSYMKLVFAIVICAILFCFIVFTKVDGFQNAMSNPDTNVQAEMCDIFRATYNSLQRNYDSIVKLNPESAEPIKAHMNSIKEQMDTAKC